MHRFSSPHLYAVAAFLFFALMNACIKTLAGAAPLALVLTVRFWIGFWMMYPIVHRKGGYVALLKTSRFGLHGARALLGMIAVGCSFYVLPLLPLADANALGQVYPFFLLLMSAPILGEKIQRRQYATCAIGFLGVILIASPHGTSAIVPLLVILISALSAAASDLVVRSLARTEKSLTIILWFFLMAGTAAFAWWLVTARDVQLSYQQMSYLILAGLCGGLAQYSLTEAFRYLNAGTMGPYSFLGFFFAVILGWTVFREVPNLWMISGAVLIIGSAHLNYMLHHRKPGP